MFQGWRPGFQGLPVRGHQERRQHRWQGKLTLAAAGLLPAVAGLGGRRPACIIYEVTKKEPAKPPFGTHDNHSHWAVSDHENLNSSNL